MKRILTILSVLMLAFAMAAFVACKNNTNPNYYYGYNETEHWQMDAKGNEGDRTAHVFGEGEVITQPTATEDGRLKYTCVCGYTKTEAIPALGDDRAWLFDDDNHWHVTEDGAVDEDTLSAHVYGEDFTCVTCGRYSLATEVIETVLAADIWNYSFSVTDIKIDLSNGKSSDYYDEEIVTEISIEKARVGFDENGDFYAWAQICVETPKELTLENGNKTVNIGNKSQLAVKDGMVYIKGVSQEFTEEDVGQDTYIYFKESETNYAKLSIDEFLNALNIGITTADIENFFDQMDAYSDAVKSLESILEKLTAVAPKLLTETSTKYFVGETLADGTTEYTLNFQALRDLNQTVASTTMGDVLSAVFGEDYATSIPAAITSAAKVTIGDIVAYLEQKDITVDELVEVADMFIKTYTGDADMTLDALLCASGMLPANVTFKQFVTSEVVSAYTLENILAMAQQGSEQPITVEQIVEGVNSLIEQLSPLTVYDILAMIVGGGELDGTAIAAIADQVIVVLDGFMTVSVTVNEDGVVNEFNLNMGFNGEFTFPETEDETLLAVRESLVPLVGALSSISMNIKIERNVEEIFDVNGVIEEIDKNVDEITAVIEKNFADEESIGKIFKDMLEFTDDEIKSIYKNEKGEWIVVIESSYWYESVDLTDMNELVAALEENDIIFDDYLNYGEITTRTYNLGKTPYELTLGEWCEVKGDETSYKAVNVKAELTYVRRYTPWVGNVGYDYDDNEILYGLSDDEVQILLSVLEEYDEELYETIYDLYASEESVRERTTSLYFTYDATNGKILASKSLHKWTYTYNKEDLSCQYIITGTATCSNCNATKDIFVEGSHKYVFERTPLEEGSCENVHAKTYCEICQEVFEDEDQESSCWREACYREFVLYRETDEDVAQNHEGCGRHTVKYSTCFCGSYYSCWVECDNEDFDDYDYNEENGNGYQKCNVCGIAAVCKEPEATNIGLNDGTGCKTLYTCVFEATRNEKVYATKTTEFTVEGCENHVKRYVSLQDLGDCGHYVYFSACLCGGEIDLYSSFRSHTTIKTEQDGVYEIGIRYECSECHIAVEIIDAVQSTKQDKCTVKVTKKFRVLSSDGSLIDSVTCNTQTVEHYYEQTPKLRDGAVCCDDGWYVANQCMFCEYSEPAYDFTYYNCEFYDTIINFNSANDVWGTPTENFCAAHDSLVVEKCEVCGRLEFYSANKTRTTTVGNSTVITCQDEDCSLRIVIEVNVTSRTDCEVVGTKKIAVSFGEFSQIVEGYYYFVDHKYETVNYKLLGKNCFGGIEISYKCSVCGDEYTVLSEDHTYTDTEYKMWGTTCKDDVSISQECIYCGYESWYLTGYHSYSGEVKYQLLGDSCEDGYLTYEECYVCGFYNYNVYYNYVRYEHVYSEKQQKLFADGVHSLTYYECLACQQNLTEAYNLFEYESEADGIKYYTCSCSDDSCALTMRKRAVQINGCYNVSYVEITVFNGEELIYSGIEDYAFTGKGHRFITNFDGMFGSFCDLTPDATTCDGSLCLVAFCSVCKEWVYKEYSSYHSNVINDREGVFPNCVVSPKNVIWLNEDYSQVLMYHGCPCGKINGKNDTGWKVYGKGWTVSDIIADDGSVIGSLYVSGENSIAVIGGVAYTDYNAELGTYGQVYNKDGTIGNSTSDTVTA